MAEMQEDKCLLCNNELELFIEAEDRLKKGDFYNYFKCPNCGFVTLENRENNNNFIAYNLDSKVSFSQKIVYWLFYQRLKKYKEKADILDFGAGSGNLASHLIEKGYNVNCYDIDQNSITHLKKRGLNVIENIEEIPLIKYDIIYLETVLEHIRDFEKILFILKDSLKDDGIMFISIPRIDSLQAKIMKGNWLHLDAPRHINHFSKNSFDLLCEKLGFKIIEVKHFNFHIDTTGWCSDITTENVNSFYKKFQYVINLPLVILTSIFKTTAYRLYMIRKAPPKVIK